MATLHATPLASGLVTVTTEATRTLLYTVPAGKRVVLRSAIATNKWTTLQGFVLHAPDPVRCWFASLAAFGGPGATLEFRPWLALGPGDQIKAWCGNATGVYIVLSGSIYFI